MVGILLGRKKGLLATVFDLQKSSQSIPERNALQVPILDDLLEKAQFRSGQRLQFVDSLYSRLEHELIWVHFERRFEFLRFGGENSALALNSFCCGVCSV